MPLQILASEVMNSNSNSSEVSILSDPKRTLDSGVDSTSNEGSSKSKKIKFHES